MSEKVYQIGDVIGLPPEPVIGTTVESYSSNGDPFRLIRRNEGWYMVGSRARNFPWRTIAELWFPVTVVGVAGESRCSGCGRWIAKSTKMCNECIDKGL